MSLTIYSQKLTGFILYFSSVRTASRLYKPVS